ncbi:GAG-pre-integrase domain [Popillia japonica]|uniref:GAG-pre-integrase domain n=1 Tax=Popillia japonica TaxID=7064 RepID=A0AAW1JR07_POPJA
MADDKVTLNFIKGKLLDHQLKRKAPEKTEKAVTTAFTGHAKNKIKCYACGKLGHKRINCRAYLNKKPEQAGDQKGNRVYDKNANLSVEENAVAFMTGDCSQQSSVNWFLDSGATDHMVNDIRLFRNLKKNQKSIKIAVAKQGETLEAGCIGDIDIISEVNGKHLKIPIQNVLYVPNLRHNLFSIRKIKEKGDLVAKGNRNGKLYELVFKLDKSPEETANLVTDNEVLLWHKRLGHLGKDSIKKLVANNMVERKEYPFQ